MYITNKQSHDLDCTLEEISTWKFLQFLLCLWKKITHAYLFQTALEIMWLRGHCTCHNCVICTDYESLLCAAHRDWPFAFLAENAVANHWLL